MFAKVRVPTQLIAVAMFAGVLSACGSGQPTEVTQANNNQAAQGGGGTPNAYPANAPLPGTADVQAFKTNLWDKLQGAGNPCGSCHADNQSPRFMNAGDINVAYQEANRVVDLANPGTSTMVVKVRGGHNCWLADPNACGDTLTRWITAWATASQVGGGKTITLVAPTPTDPGPSRIYPADANVGGATSFASTVWPVLTTYCSRCHTADSTSPQQPYFASSDVNVAFEQAHTKMNLDNPALSRLVLRLRNEFHNCWRIPSNGAVDCAGSSTIMENAIAAFAGGIPSTPVPGAWVTSKSLGMYSGTVASGGNRYDANVIAMYEFKTGSGDTVYDTSGVNPALNLSLSTTTAGGYQWVGGWGVQFTGGKAQGLTGVSRKLNDLIGSTGEYSIEAWAAPANVTQEDSRIVSYSGGLQTRNFTLGQTLYNYDFFARTTATNANGSPALSTPDAAQALQATLQHVVVTYSQLDGRKIYVNGVQKATAPGGLGMGTWDDTLAFVLGNEASGNRPWLGTLKLVAIHNRALTQAQAQQNFEAGVGEKYFLLFGISHIVNVPQSYIVFEVSQYDSYAYLFNRARFISLDPNAMPGSIIVKGMRIGENGTEPVVGQAYSKLNTTITDANYTSIAGASLSPVGTIIGAEKGPAFDEFFLTFEQLGNATNVRVAASPTPPPAPVDVARPSDIGVRTFDSLNETFAQITGVQLQGTGTVATRMRASYQGLKQALPSVEKIETFSAAQQNSIAQLAIMFCSEMVDDSTLRSNFFGSANFNSNLSTQADRDAFINPTIAKVLGANLASQPDPTAMHAELDSLITNTAAGRSQGLCVSNSCGGARTTVVAKAVCAAGLASAATLIQ